MTVPTVSINVPAGTQNGAFGVTVVFSEAVSGCLQSELVVSGTSGSSITTWEPQDGGTDYVATITSTQTGTAIFNVTEDVAEDVAGNKNTAATAKTVDVDTASPTVSIDIPSGVQGGVFDVTVEFSETVSNFQQSELLVSGTAGASITTWEPQDGGTDYVATITPTQTGTAIFNIAADVAEDAGENGNTVATQQTVTVDMTVPTVSINVPSGVQGGVFDVTIVFSEAVSNFQQAELVVSGTAGASITTWEPQDGGTDYVATITSTQTGTAIFNVTEDVAEDVAGNKNTAATAKTVDVDTAGPTVSIDIPSGVQNGVFDVTVVFSEAVSGFLQAELVVTGTAGSSITTWAAETGGTNYVATITPTQTGTAIFNIAADVAEDAGGNGNTAATQQTLTVDMTVPTVSINVPTDAQNGAFDVTVVFSEAVSGFQQAELVVTGTAGASITTWNPETGGTNYVATITPTQTGTAIFNVAVDVAEDTAGNGNTAATAKTVDVDTAGPTVSIDIPSGVQSGVFDVTVVFSETVSNFQQAELVVSGTSGSSITTWAAETGGTNYVATITPTQTGTAIFNIAADVAEDAGGNGNTAATQQTLTVDMTVPTVSINVPTGAQNGVFDVTVEFSEAVSGFQQAELVVTGTAGASITTWNPETGGTDYVATITPTQTGTAIFNVAVDVAQDPAAHGNTAATEQTVTVDMTVPTVSIDIPSGVQGGVFDVTVEFSEAVSGFMQAELVVSGTAGASITTWEPQDGGTDYVATITPTQTGTAIFNVAADVAEDDAGNKNTAATQQTVTVDMTVPTVSIDIPSGVQSGVFDVTVEFSEAVSGFLQAELVVSGTAGASITSWDPQTDGMDYVATITPTQTGTAIFNVAEDVAEDVAGNGNTAATQQTVTVDMTVPTVSIDIPSGVQSGVFDVTVEFSEAVSGFLQAELVVSGTASASITSWDPSPSGMVYRAGITPTSEGSVVLNVAADVAEDTAGNPNTAATEQTVLIDLTSPSATINVLSTPQNGPFEVRVEFSEAVSDFQQAELLVTGTASASITSWDPQTDGMDYVATITPTQTGTAIFNVAANVAEDDAGNKNTAATQQTVTVDMTVPTVRIDIPAGPQKEAFEVTVVFSEPVSGFLQSELLVTGTAGTSITDWNPETGGTDYVATITPTQTGTAIFNVAVDVAQDPAENGNTAATQQTVTVDMTPPTTTITVPEDAQGSVFQVTVAFNEPVSGFLQPELVVSGTAGGGITAWSPQTGGTTYIATVTSTQTGTAIFNVAADVAEDPAGNGNTAATQQTISVDMTPPTVAITLPTVPQNGAFDVTVEFSEAVSGFLQAELLVSGTAGGGITGWSPQTGGTTYIATITPMGTGTAIFNVAADVAQDTAGNGNTAATQQTISVDMTPPTVAITLPTVPQNGAFDVTVEFSEAVSGFLQAELVVSGTAGASITSWSPQEGRTNYVATITPTQTGTAIFNIAANVAQDTAGNGNTAANQQTVTVDMTRPTVSIEAPSDVQAADFQVTILFSEPVNGFTPEEFLITEPADATLTNWEAQPDRQQYVTTITPQTERNITLVFYVAANVAEDDAGNGNEAAESSIVPIDTQAPCLIFKVPHQIQSGPFDVEFSFSEPVTDFGQDDLLLAGMLEASITNWSVRNGGLYYHATIVPTPFKRGDPTVSIRGGTLTLHVPEGVAVDEAGNKSEGIDVKTVVVVFHEDGEDTRGPWIAIGVPPGTQAGAFDITIVFTEPVTNFSQADLTVVSANAFVKNWTQDNDGQHYITTIEPVASGIVTLGIAENVAQDDVGNANHAAADKSVTVAFPDIDDTRAPTVTIMVPTDNPGGAFDAEIQFSEPVTGFRQSDLNISDPCFSITRWQHKPNSQDYVATIVTTQDGTVTLSIPEKSAQDASNNWNLATAKVTLTVELPDTRVYIEATSIVRDTFEVAVVFTQPVSGFAQEELLFADNSTAVARIANWNVQGHGTRYTAQITPTKNGALIITVPAGVTTERSTAAEPVKVLISPEDVNQDGLVDAQDLSLVSKNFGEYVPNERENNPDVDRDKVVTVEDLALVQARIEGNLEITAASPQTLQSLIQHLKQLEDSSPESYLDIQALEARLAALVPKTTALLPNYPNPFNPDTWIPYQILNDSHVRIFIYDTRGTLIVSLALGYQSAGYYTDRTRAAYWDGTNQSGERVASGIYFYQLQTDNVSLLRKMVILK